MRIIALVITAALLLPGATVGAAPKPAPPFIAATLDGQTISLATLKGKAVALLFWAPW